MGVRRTAYQPLHWVQFLTKDSRPLINFSIFSAWYCAMIAIAGDQAITIVAKYQAKIHK